MFRGPNSELKLFDELEQQNRQCFTWCIERAHQSRLSGDLDSALRWLGAGCFFVSYGTGFFGLVADDTIENEIAAIGSVIAEQPTQPHRSGEIRRVLHVLTEAYTIGGHTKLCRLWVEFDQSREHHAVVVNQRLPLPENLRQTVESFGRGTLTVFEPRQSPVAKARNLRRLCESFDLVVLHMHPDDVVTAAALNSSGGPPVVFVNHADHVFWVGRRLADVVAEIRESGADVSRACRGIKSQHILPIPLSQSNPCDATGAATRQKLRSQLGIPDDAVLIASIGADIKYRPLPGYDFASAAEMILKQTKSAYLLLVGPVPSSRWDRTIPETRGRLIVPGSLPAENVYELGVDLYIEGFPIGSLTAMLEAGERGIACVRAPRTTPPPFGSDGEAFAMIRAPEDIRDYVHQAVRLVNDRQRRTQLGAELQKRIRGIHGRENWLRTLHNLEITVPRPHRLTCPTRPHELRPNQKCLWEQFSLHDPEALLRMSPAARLLPAIAKWDLGARQLSSLDIWRDLARHSGLGKSHFQRKSQIAAALLDVAAFLVAEDSAVAWRYWVAAVAQSASLVFTRRSCKVILRLLVAAAKGGSATNGSVSRSNSANEAAC